MSDVTSILREIQSGDANAAASLLPLIYVELRRLARQRLARESKGQTLDATALVHEAYVRLVAGSGEVQWDGRAHFFSAAAEAMRRILIDNARRKQRLRHGGGGQRVELDDRILATEGTPDDVVALDEALTRFAAEDPVKAKLVELKYFAGLTLEEAGKVLGISPATADRYWAFARAWLYRELVK